MPIHLDFNIETPGCHPGIEKTDFVQRPRRVRINIEEFVHDGRPACVAQDKKNELTSSAPNGLA